MTVKSCRGVFCFCGKVVTENGKKVPKYTLSKMQA